MFRRRGSLSAADEAAPALLLIAIAVYARERRATAFVSVSGS